MSMPGMVVEELSLPGITAKMGASAQKYMNNYSVKYGKFELDDLTDVMTLQEVETRAVRGDEVVVLTKDKFTFMDRYFIIISYLEKND